MAAFKKGPDFIDTGWHSFATGKACRNLDPFMMSPDQITRSFKEHSAGADIAIVEGNRGIYDGLDPQGACSTAELAKLLDLHVILVVDVTMATRTIAALIKGCCVFDPELKIKGIILNRVGGSRQENLIRETVERYRDLNIVGAVPRLRNGPFPERHMGLVPHQEQSHALKAIRWARHIAEKYLDLTAVRRIASGKNLDRPLPGGGETAASKFFSTPEVVVSREAGKGFPPDMEPVRVGIIRDRVFWFYYPENIEALVRAGASVIEVNSIDDTGLPPIDALYIGGGFPETQPEALASNTPFLNSIREAALAGLPVYAECGGFMYLGRNLIVNERTYPMAGVLPVDFVLRKKPKGHGYTVLECTGGNPYFAPGEIIKGHEFHYSDPVNIGDENVEYSFRVLRGHGIDGNRDGMCLRNVMGVYTHIHAAGDPSWAAAIVRAARSAGKHGSIVRAPLKY